MADFELNILGCGSALPTTRHLASSQIIDLRDKLYMIDCGEGTQVQMRRMRIKFSRLNHIFISHLHGDHCFGLPGLISYSWPERIRYLSGCHAAVVLPGIAFPCPVQSGQYAGTCVDHGGSFGFRLFDST